jgi:hypothetical protein
MNISRSSISSWCWGDWWGYLNLTGGSILIVDSDLWSRGRLGQPAGTALRLTGSAVFVRNSTISAEGPVWGWHYASDLSLSAEIIRIIHSSLKCTADRPNLTIEGNANIVDAQITVTSLEDTAKNRWVTISYPAIVLDSHIGPGSAFSSYPGAAAVLSLEPPGSCDEVFIDLSGIGGDSRFMMYDDGTHGDLLPGDGEYSREVYVPLSARGAAWSLPAWVVTDGRYSLQTITLTVPVREVWILVVTLALSFWLKTSRAT